ncbi:MAG TPA: two-component regulator propeller domain-containing protein, partial [Burkholderiaceae bacterium]
QANGTLWICTDNGLFRFDGFRVRREALPDGASPAILNALADRLDRLWVATEDGLYLRREDGSGPHWTKVVRQDGGGLSVAGGRSLALDDRGVLFVMQWDNQLLEVRLPQSPSQPVVATGAGVPGFAPFQGTDDASSGPVISVAGALWFGCGAGLCEWKDGRLTTWGPAQGLPAGAWSGLLAARDGSLWARSSARLAHLAPGGGRFDTIRAPAQRRWAGTIALAQDPRGAIVTATDDGVARWDGQHWQAWTPREGLPETAVRALLFDAQGSLWLGTSGRGLHRWIGYGQADHWTPVSGLPSPVVTSFAHTGDGRLWAATASGIACFDPVRRRFRPLRTPLAGAGMVAQLAVDRSGDLWWVQDGRLLTLRAAEDVARVVGGVTSPSYVVQGAHDVYIVSSTQVQRLSPSLDGLRPTPLMAGLPQAEILSDVISDGTHDWFLAGRNAYRAGHDAWEPLRDAHGTPVKIHRTAAFDDASRLWVADSHGVAVYSVRGGMAVLAQRFDASTFDGGSILFIRADADHRLWIGTDRGLFIREAGQWAHVDRSNGLLWNDVDEGAFLLEPDGSAWIGTSAGATRLRPGMQPAKAPTLRLDELQVAGRATSVAPTSPIAWRDRWMRITIATPDIGSGRSVRVEYRLHEDDPWLQIDGNVIQLESLQPDPYVLEVRAAARLATEAPGLVLRIPFEIAPPWWATSPMKVACGTGLVALWYLSIRALRRRAVATRLRLERAIAQRTTELEQSREALRELGEHNAKSLEAERKRVSRELHDEMGQQLAALRMEVSVMRTRSAASQGVEPRMLDLLLERIDRLVSSVRVLVTQLRPPVLDGGLLPAIEWLASEFMRGTGIAHCDLDLDSAAQALPPDAATMVFRIAQESFANVRRHAAASMVSVSLRQRAGRWVLEVSDDGSGFDPGSPRAGFGLLGMAERARMLGGELSVGSTPGRGTTIRLELAPEASER